MFVFSKDANIICVNFFQYAHLVLMGRIVRTGVHPVGMKLVTLSQESVHQAVPWGLQDIYVKASTYIM